MKPSLKTRKLIASLRISDVEAFPIWEFATDEEENEGQDETWVRPIRMKAIPADAYSLSVLANFTSPTGAKYRGIVGVNTAEGFEVVHAAILTEENYVFVPWPGMAGASKMAREAAEELGIEAKDLFPLSFRLGIPVEGELNVREGCYSYDGNDA